MWRSSLPTHPLALQWTGNKGCEALSRVPAKKPIVNIGHVIVVILKSTSQLNPPLLTKHFQSVGIRKDYSVPFQCWTRTFSTGPPNELRLTPLLWIKSLCLLSLGGLNVFPHTNETKSQPACYYHHAPAIQTDFSGIIQLLGCSHDPRRLGLRKGTFVWFAIYYLLNRSQTTVLSGRDAKHFWQVAKITPKVIVW